MIAGSWRATARARSRSRILQGLVTLGGVAPQAGQQGRQHIAVHELALQGAGQGGVVVQGAVGVAGRVGGFTLQGLAQLAALGLGQLPVGAALVPGYPQPGWIGGHPPTVPDLCLQA